MLCRILAHKRESRLTNHKLCKVKKCRKKSKNFFAGKILQMKCQRIKRKENRKKQRRCAHIKKIILGIHTANKLQMKKHKKHKPRQKTTSQPHTTQVNIQKLIKKKDREKRRKKVRNIKKLVSFIARISNGNQYVFVVLYHSIVYNYLEKEFTEEIKT